MISPYLCTDSHRDISISLVPVYSAETRLIGEIGCDDCISNLDTVDLLPSYGPMPIVPGGINTPPPPSQELRFKRWQGWSGMGTGARVSGAVGEAGVAGGGNRHYDFHMDLC